MSKRKAKRSELSRPPTTFDVLTICFSERTVTYKGRTLTTEADCLAIPLTSDVVAMYRTGWVER